MSRSSGSSRSSGGCARGAGHRAARFAGALRVAGSGCLPRTGALPHGARGSSRGRDSQGEELRHRHRHAGRAASCGWPGPGALPHQRDDLRQADRKAQPPRHPGRRTDRLRARPGLRAARGRGHDPPAPAPDPAARGPGRLGALVAAPGGGGHQRHDGRAGARRRAARQHDPDLGGHRGCREPPSDRLRGGPGCSRARAERRGPGPRRRRSGLHGEGRDGQRVPPDLAAPHLRRGRRGRTVSLHPCRRLAGAHGRAQHPSALVEGQARRRRGPLVHLHLAGGRARRD